MSKEIKISRNQFSKDVYKFIEDLKLQLNWINIKNIRLIIPCRWWEIIWSLLKNNLWLSESQVFRIKFDNMFYHNWNDEILIKDIYDKKKFENIIKKKDENLLWIFIDDLIDSWSTIWYIKKKLKNKRILTWVIYSKEWKNKEKVDICCRDLDDWRIVFPWEEFYTNDKWINE